jgi:hypothetical protein
MTAVVVRSTATGELPKYTTGAIRFDDRVFNSPEKEAHILDDWGFVEYRAHYLI